MPNPVQWYAILSSGSRLLEIPLLAVPKVVTCDTWHRTVAHVKSEETDKWWRFDDETSSLMERGPDGESSDHGVAPTVDKNGAPAKVRLCKVHF